jgi:hypothetical protein
MSEIFDGGVPERLPIKLILPDQGASHRVPGGGSKKEPFRAVDEGLRESLTTQVSALRAALLPQMRQVGAVPIRVQLISKAFAKSHRPRQLFSESTCPIVGAGRPGELFLKATPAGLNRIRETIGQATSDALLKEISSIQAIEPVTPEHRRKRRTSSDILRRSPRSKSGFLVRVRLFDFAKAGGQERLRADFFSVCNELELPLSAAGYRTQSQVYSVECHTAADVEVLSRIVGVRSVVAMPLLRTIRSHAFNPAALPPSLPSPSDFDGDYPVVGVVDSGVSDAIPALNTWVVGRESSVALPYRNPSHGTFVAGLVVWGDRLNPHLSDVDSQPCGLHDFQVIPNWDPSRGETEAVTEQEFLQALEDALKQHANRIKVWNLSLGTDEVCSEDEFSALAEALDNLQEEYQVTFVISAGNYETLPLLDFPRVDGQVASGRITAPGDSVLGITVGSISHLEYASSGPKRGEPSPFSRHGAGPNYIIKPDLVHYGGTCSTDASHMSGVRSVTETGCAEDIGTSFATPLVARSLAQIYHQISPKPTPVLARALLTHHARDPRTLSRVPAGEEDFLGFGRPVPPPYCLRCEPYQSTLVFEDRLRPGFFLEWDDFPYPPSLQRGGKYYGEVTMTIAFAPARGSRWGSEYCETHIDAHLGVYRTVVSRKNGTSKEKFFGLVPLEHAQPGRLYEEVQVRELRKWAPVRTYHGDLSAGERGNRWRLKVQLLTRHGVEAREAAQSQPFALIVTIADPQRKAPVYDEMSRIIHNQYQSQNLNLRAGARIRAQT